MSDQAPEPNNDENDNNVYDGHLMDSYSAGDFVSWKRLGSDEKEYGYIQEIYVDAKSNNRKFALAKVLKIGGSSESFNLSYIKLESK